MPSPVFKGVHRSQGGKDHWGACHLLCQYEMNAIYYLTAVLEQDPAQLQQDFISYHEFIYMTSYYEFNLDEFILLISMYEFIVYNSSQHIQQSCNRIQHSRNRTSCHIMNSYIWNHTMNSVQYKFILLISMYVNS